MEFSAPLPAAAREAPELGEVEVAAKDAERPRFRHGLDPTDAILSISGSLALHFGPPIGFLIFTVWAAVFAAFCGVAPAPLPALSPPPPPELAEKRVAVKLVELREVVPEPPRPIELAPAGTSGAETAGVALEMLVEKKSVTKVSSKVAKLTALKGRKGRAREREYAILGLLSSRDDKVASIFGSASLDSGIEGGVVYGGLIGNSIGESEGVGGLGLRGTGPGGGGTGEGIGLGGIGTIGRGSGTIAHPHIERVELSVEGGLDRAIVDRILRRAHIRLRSCRRIEGRVAIAFAIEADGSTSSIDTSGSSVSDGEALACITRVFGSMRFPSPESGKAQVRTVLSITP